MTNDPLALRLAPLIDHPLHRLLGLEACRSHDGAGHLAITVSAINSSPAGGLHGGVVYLLTDVCAMLGLMSRPPADQHAVTHDIPVSVVPSAGPVDPVRFQPAITPLWPRPGSCPVGV